MPDTPQNDIQPVARDAAGADANLVRVLDKGFVRLVEVMGNDAAIVQAARVSYGTGTKSVREDRGLIHYLMQHQHTTPFEMVEFKFHAKMPVFVARQWIRHRTANVNEISGRYSIMKDEFWEPTPEDFRSQSATNRQGSTESTLDAAAAHALRETFIADQRTLYQHYEEALAKGVAREIARINLPLSLYTEWYWKVDLHNLLHFLKLRLDAHAQKEIRVFAEVIATFVQTQCPIAWEAFTEYELGGAAFSKSEREAITDLISDRDLAPLLQEKRIAQLKKDGASETKIKREIAELNRKLCLDEPKK